MIKPWCCKLKNKTSYDDTFEEEMETIEMTKQPTIFTQNKCAHHYSEVFILRISYITSKLMNRLQY